MSIFIGLGAYDGTAMPLPSDRVAALHLIEATMKAELQDRELTARWIAEGYVSDAAIEGFAKGPELHVWLSSDTDNAADYAIKFSGLHEIDKVANQVFAHSS